MSTVETFKKDLESMGRPVQFSVPSSKTNGHILDIEVNSFKFLLLNLLLRSDTIMNYWLFFKFYLKVFFNFSEVYPKLFRDWKL